MKRNIRWLGLVLVVFGLAACTTVARMAPPPNLHATERAPERQQGCVTGYGTKRSPDLSVEPDK